ncbi:hypothetical protein BDV95DRAFT_503500 [Massariosphaeria phaeospora]|uniref:Uncharacterized protein n=1 Tax=Massariosphaeria phaeospora TaxID=100035 RepID=A0A7C8I7L9_9PLEO|nr:hypothetical protein BDV95DRAFT_503500 [Massariosphaeria phaeospora]
MTSSSKTPTPIGANKAAQDAGFKHFKAFLEAYGLRLDNTHDVEEGKDILRSMGYALH